MASMAEQIRQSVAKSYDMGQGVVTEPAPAVPPEPVSGPRPCSRCSGRIFWLDRGGVVRCTKCDKVVLSLVVEYLWLQQRVDGEYVVKGLHLNPQEMILGTRRLRWGTPQIPNGEAWAEGLNTEGVWAQEYGGASDAYARVDVDPGPQYRQSDFGF